MRMTYNLLLCFHLMSNQNPLKKKKNINKYKYPVSSCTCAIVRCMCPFEWVNNHAEKPYVQSVGCPTFRDDDVRRNIIGVFLLLLFLAFFFFEGGGKKQADHMVNKYCGKNQTKLSRPLYFLFGRVKANAGFSLGFVGLCTIAQTQIHLFQH